MKVKYTYESEKLTFSTLTKQKIYEVLEISQFGNRTPEYKIKNDLGNEIWVNSVYFVNLIDCRDSKINRIINPNKTYSD